LNTKLALGTVQFGLQYGVANTSGKVPAAEVGRILGVARQHGVDTLDTAIAYGDSEACLGAAGVADLQVVSKLPPLPSDGVDVQAWVAGHVRTSLERLGTGQLAALLLHRSQDIIGPHAQAYQRALADTKQRGLCRAVGVSIYAPDELAAIWAHASAWRPDLVQAPFNVLDRRLQTSGWMQTLKQAGVRMHTRSAFLQGLLLMPAARRPQGFARWSGLLDRWQAWCAHHGLSPLQAALQFACAQADIERVVVGVDTAAQLTEILAGFSPSYQLPPADLVSEELALIDPSRWSRP
jgi:aryl-alcohol dehydrogenase-like predicted oxidoreductase